MQQGTAQARAQLEAMAAKGGPGAEMAKQQLQILEAQNKILDLLRDKVA